MRSGRNAGRDVDYVRLNAQGKSLVVTKTKTKVGVPPNYRAALKAPDALKWDAAMRDELAALKKNDTWDVVDRPTNQRVLRARWVYDLKRGSSGEILRYKARFVGCGYGQEHGVDYTETFAAVVKPATVNILMAVAAAKDWEIEQMDFVTAFLNGVLTEKVYVEQPKGFEQGTNQVVLLKKALYGLKQSSHVWYETLKAALMKLQFTASAYDPGLFYMKQTDIYLVVHVDDVQLYGADIEKINKVKAELMDAFPAKDLGKAEHYLGIKIVRDRKAKTIKVSQTAMIEKILEEYGMSDCNPVSTPMETGLKLMRVPEDVDIAAEDAKAYIVLLGKMRYLIRTRPDIEHALNKLAQYSIRPGPDHQLALKRVLRYLSGTRSYGLTYRGPHEKLAILGYTDSNWAEDVDDAKSTAGYVFKISGAAISWCSRKQDSVAISTCEAEYMAQSLAAQEAVWLGELWQEMGLGDNKVKIYADNKGAIALASNHEYHKRSKHIAAKYHFTRDLVKKGAIDLVYLPTKEMLADGMTKAQPRPRFQLFREELGIIG